MDSEGNNMHLLTCVDEVLAWCEICQAFEKAPHAPVAGATTVAVFNEKLQAGLPSLDDILALRVMDVFSKNSLLILSRARNPQGVWDAFCSSWVGVLAPRLASSWMRAGNGRMSYWRHCVPNAESNCFFKGLAHARFYCYREFYI